MKVFLLNFRILKLGKAVKIYQIKDLAQILEL